MIGQNLHFSGFYLLSEQKASAISQALDVVPAETIVSEEKYDLIVKRFQRFQEILMQEEPFSSDRFIRDGSFTSYPKKYGVPPRLIVTGKEDQLLARSICTKLKLSFKDAPQESLKNLIQTIEALLSKLEKPPIQRVQ